VIMRDVQNFVAGRSVPAAECRTTDLVNPSTGAVFGRAPLSGPEDVDAAYSAAAQAFPGWGRSTPAERQLALLRIADTLEQHAAELVALECENTGKPNALTASDELPPMVDQVRFFAGAARVLQGTSAGGVPGRAHLVCAAGTGRGVRAGGPMELPDDDGGVEVRPGVGRGQHRGAQTVGHHPGHHGADGGAGR